MTEPFAAPDPSYRPTPPPPPEPPAAISEFGTPLPAPGEVAVNQFGTPILAGPTAAYPASVTPIPTFLPYGQPDRTSRPAWVLPVGAVAGLLVLLVTAYVVFSSLRPATTNPASAAPSIDLAHLPTPTTPAQIALPKALTTTVPAGSNTVVTPAQARQVVAAAWGLREVLLTTRNVTALSSLETGSALAGDQDRTSCGCLIDHQPAEAEQTEVFVAAQQHYPASFVAEVAFYADGSPSAEILGFTRANAAQSWKVAFDTDSTVSDPIQLDHAVVDSQGYTAATSASVVSRARALPSRLAAYWNAAKQSGKVPAHSVFAPGYWTTEWAATGAAHPNGTVQSNGLTGRLTYTGLGTDRLFAANLGPVTLSCELIRRSAVYTGYHGSLPAQDAGQRNWGPTVAPGVYREIDDIGLSQTCFYLDNRSATAPVSVTGGDPGDESIATGRGRVA